MIAIWVSAVFFIRDSYTRKPVSQNQVQTMIDGEFVKPDYKPGGYFVIKNLEVGRHEAVFWGNYFQKERIHFSVSQSGFFEASVVLKPAEGYPFGQRVTTLNVLTKPGSEVFIAIKTVAPDGKIAQDKALAGDMGFIVYSGRSNPLLPGYFIISDEKKPEICLIQSVSNNSVILSKPLAFDHKRGCALYESVRYVSDTNGNVLAVFREKTEALVFVGEKLSEIKLSEGINRIEV